jgi:hypothetical protein
VDLDQRALLLSDGHNPSTSDPLLHQQMVYAVCSTVYAAFRRALGRHVTWGFAARGPDTRGAGRLRIRPHAFEDQNAYYDRTTGELCFGYFRARKTFVWETSGGPALSAGFSNSKTA